MNRRLIIDTDAKNEADDQYAIVHALLSPSLVIEGIATTSRSPTGHRTRYRIGGRRTRTRRPSTPGSTNLSNDVTSANVVFQSELRFWPSPDVEKGICSSFGRPSGTYFVAASNRAMSCLAPSVSRP